MKLVAKIELTDFRHAFRMHMGPSRVRAVLVVAVAILALVVFEIATGDALVLTLALVGSLAYLAIHFMVLLPRRMDQLYQQQKLLHEPVAIEINDQAFITKTRYTEAILPWTLFRKWKASPVMILLYQSDAMYHILARRWFASQSDFDRLQVILGKHLGPPCI